MEVEMADLQENAQTQRYCTVNQLYQFTLLL